MYVLNTIQFLGQYAEIKVENCCVRIDEEYDKSRKLNNRKKKRYKKRTN